ncbi:MAG: nucleotidyltransferase substrate binding protein [Bacteroidetes bacterium]|nr:nucleotidyltransferase substrate binding protein [Bacteroidota bacterium]
MELLLDKNLTAYTYDEQKATVMEQLIHHKYFPIMKDLLTRFKLLIDGN